MTLGDRVRDAVSESDRDVDVTITVAEPDGTRTAFTGYEAKMEKGALDVADVEQLHPEVLAAVTFSPENALVHMWMIRLTEKQKNFIHRLKVRA